MSDPATTTDHAALRVVLVGAREAARLLRRDPNVELIRTDDPLDAVAELSEPLVPGAPARTAAVIDPEALPEGEAAAFAEAARSASPGVLLLRYGDNGDTEGIYDGELDLAAGVAGILARFRSQAHEHQRESEPPAPTVAETGPAETEERPEARIAPADDAELELLESMLRGPTSLDVKLGAIAQRLQTPARYSERAGEGAEVARRGRRYGWLSAPGIPRDRLELEAAKLARWMALEEQIAQLRTAAFVDDLTGAWNRAFFRRRLPQALDAARRQRRDVTLMLYDIDNFKTYNDEYGHGAGDEILTQTVRLLRSVIRPTDFVCRIGGDEFAVIFDDPRGSRGPTGQHPRSIGEIARRFQKQICEHRFPALGGGAKSTLTISGGMATFPWDASDAESLITTADELLLESKRRGKNAITLGPGADRACRVEFPEVTPDD